MNLPPGTCAAGEEETRGRKGHESEEQRRAHRFLLLRALLGLLLLLVPLELRLCLPRHQAQARVISTAHAPREQPFCARRPFGRALAQPPPTCVPIWNPLILSLVSCALEPCHEPKTPACQPQPPARWPACVHARSQGNPGPQHRAAVAPGARNRGRRARCESRGALAPRAARVRAPQQRQGRAGQTRRERAGGEELQRLPARQPTFWSFLASRPQGSSSGASPMAGIRHATPLTP